MYWFIIVIIGLLFLSFLLIGIPESVFSHPYADIAQSAGHLLGWVLFYVSLYLFYYELTDIETLWKRLLFVAIGCGGSYLLARFVLKKIFPNAKLAFDEPGLDLNKEDNE
ncbi:MAG: hypothetical protein J6M18_04830 [Actinomycetaceae bacterium]|nr:hypothetical protein [Actinomycetaceae bacterium]